MQYTLTISQTKALEWGLNAQQALLFSFVYECPSWARPVTNDNGVFFALSKAKIVEELPLLTDKPDTAYRLLKQLEKAGVIELSHTSGITLVRLTDKGREWNKALDGSEKYPSKKAAEGRKNIRGASEKSPSRVGNKSEAGSEKSPTNQGTNNQGTSHNSADADADPKTDLFAKFWKLYPKKVGKQDARKAWAKLKVTDDLFDQIVAGLARHCVSPEWIKNKGQYIQHPTRWLNGKRWEDEVTPPATNVHQFPGSSNSEFEDSDNDLSWMEQLRK